MKAIRMSPDEYERLQARPEKGRIAPLSGVREPKASKYRSRKTGGYASVKEAKRAQELKLLLAAGKIRNLREQVPFELIPRQTDPATGKLLERECRYVADFVYCGFHDVEALGGRHLGNAEIIVEDCKGGIRTKDYIIKRKLMLQIYNIRIRET